MTGTRNVYCLDLFKPLNVHIIVIQYQSTYRASFCYCNMSRPNNVRDEINTINILKITRLKSDPTPSGGEGGCNSSLG